MTVRKGREYVHYACMCVPFGWICGKCGRGNLGPLPKEGDQCRVCKAKVSQVIKESEAYADDRGFRF